MAAQPADDRILRAKYLDWCSAKVADRFLKLTPDEIYELAHQARAVADGMGVPAGEALRRAASRIVMQDGAAVRAAILEGPGPVAPGFSYRDLVQRVTEALTVSMELPPFDRWAEAYRSAPERFEAEMLGFWEEGRGPAGQ